MSELLIVISFLLIAWLLGYWLRDLETTITVGQLSVMEGNYFVTEHGDSFQILDVAGETLTVINCVAHEDNGFGFDTLDAAAGGREGQP